MLLKKQNKFKKVKKYTKNNQLSASRHVSANGISTKMGWVYISCDNYYSRQAGRQVKYPIRDMGDTIFGPIIRKVILPA